MRRHPGVTVPQTRARRLQIGLAWVMVMTPVLGVVAAILFTWGRGVGPSDLFLLAVMYLFGVLGIEVGFHRYFSHKAFQAQAGVCAALAILGSMAAQGPILFWAATHRRHHAHSDEPGDPHTPHIGGRGWLGLLRGLWHAHIGWLFLADTTDVGKYAPDLLRDRLILKLNNFYPLWLLLGLTVPALAGGLLTWSWTGCLTGFLWGGLVRTFLVHHATWSVNSLCHVFGDRPFDTHDQSTNNPWLVPSSLGGSWHNNHHAFPTAARNSLRWWQLDPSGWFVSLLEASGLVWNAKVPTEEMIQGFNERHPRRTQFGGHGDGPSISHEPIVKLAKDQAQ
jgi:stearoyl-CoA desaturase (Delta-9 desaturase)